MIADPEPLELGRLVPELDELIDAVTRAFGGALAVFDRHGQKLAGADLAGPPTSSFEHEGERLADLAATGPRAAEALELFRGALGLLVHHANARELAATTHEAAMRVTFAELTEHNQRLQRAVSRLEELDRLKSNFLATMSHELRTPLTSVIGYAEMMVEGIPGPINQDQTDYLNTILNKADQLLGLITTVLDVASLESGQLALERTQLSLTEVVTSEVETWKLAAVRRGISIDLTADDRCEIVGDRRKIRQIISSLLSNAVKFTPDRGKVAVAVRPMPDATRLVVSDSGIGIGPHEVAKIFEPFFQVDSSSTRAFGGTGLGLTLAKAYVEAHGGKIWVDTSPGQGSTFTVAFPHPEKSG